MHDKLSPNRHLLPASDTLIRRKQRQHFILLVVLPQFLSLGAIISLFWYPIRVPEIAALFLMWIVTGLGISIGFHRLFSHLAYRTIPAVQTVLAIAGSMAGQGGIISWVTIHRRHHQVSDTHGDPHSPNLSGSSFREHAKGITHAHVGWMMDYEFPNPVQYSKDLLKNGRLRAINKHYYGIVVAGLVIPAVFVAIFEDSWTGLVTGLLWGGAVRIALLSNTIWMINSLLHCVGERSFETGEHSRNAPLLALISFGESFHNNHHAFPRSALLGLFKAHLDPGYWAILALQKTGLADRVWIPTKTMLQERNARKSRCPSDVLGLPGSGEEYTKAGEIEFKELETSDPSFDLIPKV